MKFKCVDATSAVDLTEGKIYNGRLYGNDKMVTLTDDKEELGTYCYERFEKIEEFKTYKGWEILKMIDEGKLKEGDKYINNNDREFTVEGWLEPTVKAFVTDIFTIKEKEYMTFMDAVKTGKKFKHKDMEGECKTFGVILSNLAHCYTDDVVSKMVQEKAWEVLN